MNNSHYHNAMTELNHGLRGPALQRSLFAYARASPTELLRSKLSSQEIRHRALAFIPDETLAHIPEDESEFSLFRGFEATVLTDQHDRYGTESKRREAAGVVQEIPGADETSSSIRAAQGERHELNNTLETLGVRKEICSIEIREIDKRIADMVNKRKIVLHRLEALEVKEMEMTRDLQDADSKLEDLLDEAANAGDGSNAALSPQNPVSNPDAQSDSTEEGNSFMSASIYGKLPSPKSRRRKPAPRRSTTVRHELLDPGTSILNFQAHTDSLAALDFDVPYGTMVTSALDDTVRVWDLNLGRCVGLLEGHQASVRCLQVDEQRVATGSMDASIRLWDLGQVDSQTHRTLGDAAETEGAPSVAPLPPNSTANCHILTLTAHVAEITAIHFHANMLVSGSADKTLRQWDLVKGRCVQTLDVLWAAAQASSANSPLARSLSGEKEQSSARPIWQNSSMRQADSPSSFVGALQCFDAALACGTADGMVRLWDLRSGQVNRSLVGHTGAVTSLQFDDRKMVTGSADRSIRVSVLLCVLHQLS